MNRETMLPPRPGGGARHLSRRDRAVRWLLAVAATTALAGVLGSLGYVAWWLELFSSFRLQYALLLSGCGVGLLLLRRPAAGLAALALAATNALPLVHYYAAASEPLATGPPVRALLVNVWFRNRQHDAVLRYVRSRHPDIAIFLEATPEWREALRGLDDVLPYQAQAREIFVASRRPLGRLEAIRLGGSGAMAVKFYYQAEGAPLTVIGAHANWPLGASIAASRDLELAQLASIARVAARPLLLLGDLNVTSFSPIFDYVLFRSGLRDCTTGHGFVATWPTQFPPLAMQIDHCLADRKLAVTRVSAGPYIGSDHYPLEVTVRPAVVTTGGESFTASRQPPTFRR